MRYFVGFLVAIGLLILLIVLLVHGGGHKAAQVPSTKKSLTSYSNTDTVVRLTLDGPINSQQEHQQTQITVGQNQVVFDDIEGYENHVTEHHSYDNNQSAYYNFLSALQHVGFTQGDTHAYSGNETAVCPLGTRYIFDLIQGSKKLQHFWSSSCGKPKTYLGQVGPTITLFENQVPGFHKLPHVTGSGFSL